MNLNNFNIFEINKKNIIFIHIPKTGGTSILSHIYKYFKINDFSVRHYLASEYDETIWSSAYSFCVVRNPFDRLVSHWKYHTTATDSKLFSNLGIENYRNFTLTEYFNIVESHNDIVNNWRSMKEFMDPPYKKKIDTILRFEQLQEDWIKRIPLAKIIGENLPHVKKSNHLHYAQYYTPELISRVSDFYKDDLEAFGYSFNY